MQLASEGGKDDFDNAIPLCLDCHADQTSYDHKHPKGTKYTSQELRQHRDLWYEKMRASPAVRSDYDKKPADKSLFHEIQEALPWQAVQFVDEHDFGAFFWQKSLAPFDNFLDRRRDPTFQFLDADLEGLRAGLVSRIDAFLEVVLANTFSVERRPGILKLPDDWRSTAPERRRKAHLDMNLAARDLAEAYRTLIAECRIRLS